jgi:ankyrin repeat protein
VRIATGGDLYSLRVVLKGAGARVFGAPNSIHLIPARAGEPVVLRPGEHFELDVPRLQLEQRNYSWRGYFTEPGEGSVLVVFQAAREIACHEELDPLAAVSEAVPVRVITGGAGDAAPLCPGEAQIEGLPPTDAQGRDPSEADLLRCIVQGRDADALSLLRAGAPSGAAPAYAAAAGRADLLRELLAAGSDPNSTGPYGDMPILTLAASRGRLAVVKLLLAAGAAPDQAGDDEFAGGAALSAALRAGHLDIGRALLEAGAAPDRRESYHGETALWQLVCRDADAPERNAAIELLLEHGADPDARDHGGMDGWPSAGRTPLACAVVGGDERLARRLLRVGADPNSLVQGGIRLLELARTKAPDPLVELLESHGASVARPLPSPGEVYAALAEDGLPDATSFYMLGAQRIDPTRRGGAFASTYRDRQLVPWLATDLDGDGRPEWAAIVQRPGQRPAELVLAVLGRAEAGWRVLHRRSSLAGNPVVSAALEQRDGAVGVHVFEARYQCDDERPIQYELAWDAQAGSVKASVDSQHLHPSERRWDCGE